MRRFAQLFEELDATTRTTEKLKALSTYFDQAPPADRLWALALLAGRRPKRQVTATQLRLFAVEQAGIPLWLFEESYHSVGDLAETVALLVAQTAPDMEMSLSDAMQLLARIDKTDEATKREAIVGVWQSTTPAERFVFTKLITGGFRVGVSQTLVVKALAGLTGQPVPALTHRLMGTWLPSTTTWDALVLAPLQADISRPYPFFLAYPAEAPDQLGQPEEWLAEWKWDGIRSQTIKRAGEVFVWSRGEDLITEKFPEIVKMAQAWPDGTVIDGEILPMIEGTIADFNVLQTRIGRKNLSAKILKEAPAVLYAYDMLEFGGEDLRQLPLASRRQKLAELVQATDSPDLMLSAPVAFDTWAQLAELRLKSRAYSAEGFMLKRLSSTYQTGRKKGDWWKWKIDPLSIDAVLIYAQKGHGRRADIFSDYTFAVWDGDRLVPFAKAYSGLSDAEMNKVDAYIKANTLEKFGPVRTVKPGLVMEIGFEGIQASTRHKSGIAVRFPRILRWRIDKPKEEADTLANLQALLQAYGTLI